MARCEKCGADFKPYWAGTEIEEKSCEHCAYEAEDKKGQCMVLAFAKVVVGLALIMLSVAGDLFFLKIAGFVILLFGVLKLVEVATISQKPSAVNS